MKKTILLLVLGLAFISLSAQNRMSYTWEFVAGIGIGKGPQFIFTPEFVAQYVSEGGFRIGAGAGTRFARPCYQYTTKNGSHRPQFCNELEIPMFLRLGYGKEKLYANLDAGYAVSVLSFVGPGTYGEAKKEPNYKGLFFEPQFGWRVGERSALALGLLWQHSTLSNHVQVENGSWNDPSSYSISDDVTALSIFTPAVTIRYVLGF